MRMIAGLSHLTLAAQDPQATAADYARLFETAPTALRDVAGRAAFRFDCANLAFLVTDAAGGAPGLAALAFRAADFSRATERLTRCGAPVGVAQEIVFSHDGGETRWREARIDAAAAAGMPLVLTDAPATPPAANAPRLDHVVVRTADPQRAIALYGGRLDLDMRLDRSNPAWNARLIFFRCGDLVVEIAHVLSDGVSDRPDTFGGLSWRVEDIEAMHARLSGEGFAMSPVRVGRRPGSRVCTVRDRTGGVPTILLSVEPRAAQAA